MGPPMDLVGPSTNMTLHVDAKVISREAAARHGQILSPLYSFRCRLDSQPVTAMGNDTSSNYWF